MVTKDELITSFKNGCVLLSPKLIFQRSLSVKYQFQRNIWELECHYLGLIRIYNGINNFKIRLLPHQKHMNYLKCRDLTTKEFTFEITENEYGELEKLYFGDFKRDEEYHDRICKLYSK